MNDTQNNMFCNENTRSTECAKGWGRGGFFVLLLVPDPSHQLLIQIPQKKLQTGQVNSVVVRYELVTQKRWVVFQQFAVVNKSLFIRLPSLQLHFPGPAIWGKEEGEEEEEEEKKQKEEEEGQEEKI